MPFGSTVKKASQKLVEGFYWKCGDVDGIVVVGNVVGDTVGIVFCGATVVIGSKNVLFWQK